MSQEFLLACEHLVEHQHSLAKAMTELQFKNYPALEKKFGKSGRTKCFEDNKFHINYLVEAVRFDNTRLFTTYLQWAPAMLQARNVQLNDLQNNLLSMDSVFQHMLPGTTYKVASNYIKSGIESLKNVDPLPETYLRSEDPFHGEARQYLAYLLKADQKNARALVYTLIKAGQPIKEIYEFIFQSTQYEIGLLWQTNRISVAHEHYCTAATQTIIAGLYNEIFSNEKKHRKMIGCAVSGELHEMGIRMLTDFFELDGWDTYFLGANMPDANLITAACEQDADILAISVTSPFNLGKAETLINKVKGNSRLDRMKIIIGGYPFNSIPDLWKKIGADGHAANARQAVELAERLINKQN